MLLDLLGIIIVALFAVTGMISGLLLQVLRLGASIVAAAAALAMSGPAMKAFPMLVDQPAAREVLYPFVLFTTLYLVLDVVARVIVSVLHIATGPLSLLDRLGGLVLGALKGVVLVYFLVAVGLAAETSAKGRLSRLDTSKSIVAGLVRAWPVGRLKELSHVQMLRDLNVDIDIPSIRPGSH
jgi:uncharacterized membrane protein required for colicin V production